LVWRQVDRGVDKQAGGDISIRDLSAFVWAWEPDSTRREGDMVIAFPSDSSGPAIYTVRQGGRSGRKEPGWVGGAGEGAPIVDGGVVWEKARGEGGGKELDLLMASLSTEPARRSS